MMLERSLCNKVLTVGCRYKRPHGGVSQVLYTYSEAVFSPYKFVATTTSGSKASKALQLVAALSRCTALLLFDRKIKIVHIHAATKLSFRRKALFVSLAKFFGKKVVFHAHGGGFKDYYEQNKDRMTRVLRKCDCIVALSQEWQAFFADEMKLPNVRVVNNVIEAPVVNEMPHDGKLHLLFLGLVTKQKGIFDLLDVIAAHKADFEGRLLLHVGGSENPEFDRMIDSNGLSSLVRHEGWVSGDKKIALLNMCDVFVLPSYVEGLPISILEAMSYSKPIVATTVGGIPSIVENGKNGFLHEPGDKSKLYEAINYYLSHPQECGAHGEISRKISEKFLPEAVSDNLESIYKELLK